MRILGVLLLVAVAAMEGRAAAATRPAGAKGTVVVPDRFVRRWDPVTVFFDRDVGPAAGGPEDEPGRFVTVTPPHPGAFTWLDARTLQFRPAEPWPPLARFTYAVAQPKAARGQPVRLTTLMAAPATMLPTDGAVGLGTVDAVTLTFAEPIDEQALARMVTIELRPLPGVGARDARWMTSNDFRVKALDRRGRGDLATYVLELREPIALGTRAIVHLRLALDDDATASFVELGFSTAEPFRVVEVGCRSYQARRVYPVTPEGTRYPAEEALRCGVGDEKVIVELSAAPRELSPVEARNLVRFTPAVDGLAYGVDGKTLEITGNFDAERVYRLTIAPAGVVDQQGRPLAMNGESEVHLWFPRRARELAWRGATGIVERHGPQAVPVLGRGEERVDLRIQTIEPLDRAFWPFPRRPLAIDESAQPPGPGEEPPALDQLGRISEAELSQQMRTLGSPPISTLVDLPLRRDGRAATFGLDLEPHLARLAGRGRAGSYLVGLRRLDGSSDRSWMRLQVTDLVLTTLEEPDAVRFVVTSFATAEPVAGATVRVEGVLTRAATSQWTTLAEGTTGSDGTFFWKVPGFEDRVGRRIGRLVVSTADDVLILDPSEAPDVFADNHWHADRADWLAWAFEPLEDRRPKPETLCHVFTDRPVYRPDEVVHVKGYLRERARGRLRPLRPEGFVVVEGPGDQRWKRPVQVTEAGSFYLAFSETNIPTGDYSAYFENAKAEIYGRVDFKIEAYRIPTFEVDLHAPDKAPLDREFRVELTSTYYAGGKVAGRPVAWRVTQFPYTWSPKAREGFHYSSDGRFSGSGRFESQPALEKADTTDDAGAATLTLNPALEPTAQPRTYVVEATVTGPDDQTVTNTRRVTALPPFVLGLKVPRYLEHATAVTAELLVAGPDGTLLAGTDVTVRLLSRQWHSHLRASDFSDGVARYVTDVVDERVSETTVPSGTDPSRVTLALPHAGVYVVELEAHDRLGRAQVVTVDFYAGGAEPVAWARPVTRVFEVASDKEAYDPGETAALVLKSPYQEARALAIVETPDGNEYRWIDVTGGTATFPLLVQGAWTPRVPIHFVLMRGRIAAPVATDGIDLGKPSTVAATAWVKVNPVDNRVDVRLEHPGRARPGETVPVTVRLADPRGNPLAGEVTLWLVDQAVLALGKEQRLDPLPDFLLEMPSRLAVHDTRNLAFGRLAFAENPGGAGGEGEEQAEVFDKVTVRRTFKPVPYFNPAIAVGPDGVVTVQVALPDNLTNFKLRAKASSGPDRFGWATGDLAVRLPVIVQPALPRFVRPGDAFTAAGIGRIVEGEGGPGKASVRADGATLTVPATRDVAWAPERPERIEFPVEVATPPYTADGKLARDEVTFGVAVERLSDGAGDAFEVRLPIRDDRRRVTARILGEIGPGAPVALPALPEAPRAGTVRRTLVVSTEPALLRMAAGLDYLEQYPFGCTEQRLSIARAHVALRRFRALLAEPGGEERGERAVHDVLEWIPQVVDGQGLVAYWPGARGYVSLTAWTVQFLVGAREAGVAVDATLLDRLTSGLEQALRSDYSRFIDGEAFTERAWALAALAQAGKFNPAYAAELARRAQWLDPEGIAEVVLALAAQGDTASSTVDGLVQRLWDAIVIRLYQQKEQYGGLQRDPRGRSGLILPSETRTVAEITHAVARVNAEDPRVPLLVNALVTLGRDDGWGSTNANGAALVALAERLEPHAVGGTPRAVRIRVGADERRLALGPGAPLARLVLTSGDAGEIAVADGAAGPLGLRVETTFVPEADGSRAAAEAHGFVVVREWLRIAKGTDVPPERVPLAAPATTLAIGAGTVVEERVQVVNPEDRHYVAVVVPLAAGMEPLNPRLATAPPEATPSTPLTLEPTYATWLDDRVAFYYDSLPKGTYDFAFRTRATTPGRFIQPPAVVEMMYEAAVTGCSAGARVEVTPAPVH